MNVVVVPRITDLQAGGLIGEGDLETSAATGTGRAAGKINLFLTLSRGCCLTLGEASLSLRFVSAATVAVARLVSFSFSMYVFSGMLSCLLGFSGITKVWGAGAVGEGEQLLLLGEGDVVGEVNLGFFLGLYL